MSECQCLSSVSVSAVQCGALNGICVCVCGCVLFESESELLATSLLHSNGNVVVSLVSRLMIHVSVKVFNS